MNEMEAWAFLSRVVNEALQVDGVHHKQWYLEQIARELELDIDVDHEPGVAP